MFKRIKAQVRKEIWTETAIRLYEKQMAARDALGTKYICHPMNDQPKKNSDEVWYNGYVEITIPIPAGGVFQEATHYQNGRPVLRLVK